MIYPVAGDILFSKAQVLAHGVAPFDPMDHGLRLALHKRYPVMHKEFHHWCHRHNPTPGEAWLWCAGNDRCVANLLTQETLPGHAHHAGKATLSHVNHALHALERLLRKGTYTSLALPRLATGVGNQAWDDVWPLIQNRLEGLDIPVIVYIEHKPGKRAKEPLP